MNFDEAITVHSSWKMKLSRYLTKPDGSLDPDDVGVDNKCDLGKWIGGEGAKYSKLAQFGVLQQQHSRFHKAAAQVVRRADSGENMTAEVALGAKSEFAKTSSTVVQAIMAMKAAASKN
jgi:hypothetical protein